jgi:dTDP-4-dehydrorhamnose 3,5-epimerase
MQYIRTEIPGVWILEPQVYADARGYFMETFQKKSFENNIGKVDFIQDNESKSTFGVLRGLHFQQGEAAQAKLVRVIKGCVFDVAVDIRKNSPTYGKYLGIELSENNKRQFFIPRGLAHGFLVVSDEAVFSYKVDNPYSPGDERSLLYSDPALNIRWPLSDNKLILSEKDRKAPLLKDLP